MDNLKDGHASRDFGLDEEKLGILAKMIGAG